MPKDTLHNRRKMAMCLPSDRTSAPTGILAAAQPRLGQVEQEFCMLEAELERCASLSTDLQVHLRNILPPRTKSEGIAEGGKEIPLQALVPLAERLRCATEKLRYINDELVETRDSSEL